MPLESHYPLFHADPKIQFSIVHEIQDDKINVHQSQNDSNEDKMRCVMT